MRRTATDTHKHKRKRKHKQTDTPFFTLRAQLNGNVHARHCVANFISLNANTQLHKDFARCLSMWCVCVCGRVCCDAVRNVWYYISSYRNHLLTKHISISICQDNRMCRYVLMSQIVRKSTRFTTNNVCSWHEQTNKQSLCRCFETTTVATTAAADAAWSLRWKSECIWKLASILIVIGIDFNLIFVQYEFMAFHFSLSNVGSTRKFAA